LRCASLFINIRSRSLVINCDRESYTNRQVQRFFIFLQTFIIMILIFWFWKKCEIWRFKFSFKFFFMVPLSFMSHPFFSGWSLTAIWHSLKDHKQVYPVFDRIMWKNKLLGKHIKWMFTCLENWVSYENVSLRQVLKFFVMVNQNFLPIIVWIFNIFKQTASILNLLPIYVSLSFINRCMKTVSLTIYKGLV